MAYYTDSPAFQAMWQRAMGGGAGAGSSYRPLGLSGITNPRAKKQPNVLPPKPQAKPASAPINRPQQNPYAFNVVSSTTSNSAGGGDTFGTMGTGQDQARSNPAAIASAQGQAQAATAQLNKAMTPAQVTAGQAPVTPPKAPAPAPKKVATRQMAKMPMNLRQNIERGAGFGGIRPLMRFGR